MVISKGTEHPEERVPLLTLCVCGDSARLHPGDGPCIARDGLPNPCACAGFKQYQADKLPDRPLPEELRLSDKEIGDIVLSDFSSRNVPLDSEVTVEQMLEQVIRISDAATRKVLDSEAVRDLVEFIVRNPGLYAETEELLRDNPIARWVLEKEKP